MQKKVENSVEFGGVTNEAVTRATNKGWDAWITILEGAGAAKMLHRDIARYLYNNHLKNAWWCQMIAEGYEQSKKQSKKTKIEDVFQVTISKTLPVSFTKLHAAFSDSKIRKLWLNEKKIIVTKSSQSNSIRMRWANDDSRINVEFTKKAKDKSLLTLTHSKLETKKQEDERKKYWKEKLTALEAAIS